MHEYYSVARFKDNALALPDLEGKHRRDVVNPGFKLCAPVLKRAAGRPRKSRYRTHSEGTGLGARKRKFTRCGGSGHFGRYYDNAVDPAFGECFDENDDDQQPVGTESEKDCQKENRRSNEHKGHKEHNDGQKHKKHKEHSGGK